MESAVQADNQAMSGAFGGLIAFGLIRIETGSLVGWQYLYIVEGSLSVLAGPLAYFWIPRELPKAWFYNAEEKLASAKRADALVKANQHTDKFSWPEVFKGLTAWQVGSQDLCRNAVDIGAGCFIRRHPILHESVFERHDHFHVSDSPVLLSLSFQLTSGPRSSVAWGTVTSMLSS